MHGLAVAKACEAGGGYEVYHDTGMSYCVPFGHGEHY